MRFQSIGRLLLTAIFSLILFGCTEPETEDFTIIALPDTQFYVSSMNGGSPELFNAQTDWIVANRDSLNIVFVTQLGDCVQNGDSLVSEWRAADAAMSRLEDPETTGLDSGIPYGIAVGNHDQSPEGSADGTTTIYNWVFGERRFDGRAYYGGHFGENNDNHYQLFSAGKLDFIVIHLEYDMTPDTDILEWADGLLKRYSERRGILVTHFLIGDGYPAEFSPQGEPIYQALKENENLFLMLGGHIPGPTGEGQRVDTYNGNTIYSLMSDYQGRENGGNGWLRIMRFSPASNEIMIQTYSPVADNGLEMYETDENSLFVLPYEM